jgi:hypothetical protein
MTSEHWFDRHNKALLEHTSRRTLLTAATALVTSLGLGAVPIVQAAKGGNGGKGKPKRKRKGKKMPVCTCPTAEATSCTEAKVNHQKAKPLSRQACNYAGQCRPGMIGPQCSPGCPTGQKPCGGGCIPTNQCGTNPDCPAVRPTCCGGACVNSQTDASNFGGCGTTCESWQTCTGGGCHPECGGGEAPPCLVFITRSPRTGNLGGLAGADARCQALAKAAGLPGAYKAWLSDSTGAPRTRFRNPTGPYVWVDGTTKVADDWLDLTSGTLDRPINMTEDGAQFAGPAVVWTHTRIDGNAGGFGTNLHCENWSTTADDVQGNTGIATATDVDWTAPLTGTASCGSTARLYCFQQS